MSNFGDWEPADSYAPENTPDPMAVAHRLHELRIWLKTQKVEDAQWGQLTDDEQQVAVALGTVLTHHLIDKGRDGSALAVHEAVQFLSGQPAWGELDRDTQAVALALIDDIVRWVQIEGTEVK